MISEHFSESEIKCKCGCGQAIIQDELYRVMEIVREYAGGHSINVHCVNRCKKHNKEVGGVNRSQHLRGAAMDFHIPKIDMPDLHDIIIELFDSDVVRNIGLYNSFIHVDIRTGKKRFWDNRK